ncbi:MAG: hypothetical protein Q8R82_18445 [Hyphomonadaceae bacterium]|nr:hypothetical protein [Hyphomonadaceae bacterium]
MVSVVIVGAGFAWFNINPVRLPNISNAAANPSSGAEGETTPVLETQQLDQPVQPVMLNEHGVRFESDPYVEELLSQAVVCRTWLGGQDSGLRASLFNLLRLRASGHASPPADYDIRRGDVGDNVFVNVRERFRRRNGEDIPGAAGFVTHRYYYDPIRERFEYINSTPDDPTYGDETLYSNGHPLGFLGLHWDAVCNGMLSFPEVREARAAARAQRAAETAAQETLAPPPPQAQIEVSPEIIRKSEEPPPVDVATLMVDWVTFRDACRDGSRTDPRTASYCKRREELRADLRKAGMCHHPAEGAGATDWVPCAH